MGQTASYNKEVEEAETTRLNTASKSPATFRYQGISIYSQVLIAIAVIGALCIIIDAVLYVVLLDRVESKIFNVNSGHHEGKSAVYNAFLAVAVATYVIGIIAIIILAATRKTKMMMADKPVTDMYSVVMLWEGVLIFLLMGFGTVYLITLVGIVNSDCEDYAFCCGSPTGDTCPSHNVMDLWNGILPMSILAFILGWIAMLMLFYRSFKQYQ